VTETDQRRPVPLSLRLVEQFLNTNAPAVVDPLSDARGLRDWLADAGLEPPSHMSAAMHRRAVSLRDALRQLVVANSGTAVDAAAMDVVNELTERTGVRPVLTASGTVVLEPAATASDAWLGKIVAAMLESVVDHSWPRLKACERESCRRVFYDHSPNRSARWCSMEGCGSREKSKRAYWRRRAADVIAAP
jgi:predicted RNA-binding Zn ribbon-like protein